MKTTIVLLTIALIVSVVYEKPKQKTSGEIAQEKYVECRITVTNKHKGRDLIDYLDMCFETYKLDLVTLN